MRETRVLFFGDSHVAGVGDPTGLGWVGHVVAASFAADSPIVGYNLGVRGETSRDVARRFRTEAVPRVRPGIDCRTVFSFGVNDTAIEGARQRLSLDRSLESLDPLLAESVELGLRALVVGPAPIGDGAHSERIARISEAFRSLCRDRGASFFEIYPNLSRSAVWRREVALDDGAHPAADGYRALAEIILDTGWLHWLASEAAEVCP